MRVFGRRLLDHPARNEYEVDFDDLVFLTDDGHEIVVSVYRAKTSGLVELRSNDGVLVVLPRAANAVQFEARR